ncbi:hypothetical protein SAMN05444411_102564 [Lutibacter oricola]|uniref:Uncharacterized protein n=1 Tax=Lutibacter oricola TaxID=762486 RepID=A0A1H2XUY8_9FLAO|nr:DUF5684 domain-containing protein [Lutibacter oricola]SDW96620.1 hypothetical protein SAMN05444411_102564 [Lutibacter oricola]
MEGKLLKTSLKFGLTLGVINLLLGVFATYTFDPNNLSQQSSILISFITWVLFILTITIAHFQFNKSNGNYISFKDAILIGLIIIGVTYIISIVYSIVSYEFLLTEKIEIFNRNLSEKFGTNLNKSFISIETLFFKSLFGLLIQIFLLFVIITIESQWKIYKKAGKEGWASIIPIYNIIILLEIVKKPLWWFILLLIPFVNIIIAILIINKLSIRFGKNEGFTFGLIFLPFIFYPLLGMSKVEYNNE